MKSLAHRVAFTDAAIYFPTQLQQFQFFDKYSRFDYERGRRETWPETVDRAVEYLIELTEVTGGPGKGSIVQWLRSAGRHFILEMKALPSMRLLAMAGPAARRQNLSLFNCSYVAVDDPQAWVEMLVISMAGCGVGFSVERANVEKLPQVSWQTGDCVPHVVEDSSEGWASALQLGLRRWFDGGDVDYDFSQIRQAGKPLRTKGGRASGPEPLRQMLAGIRAIVLSRQGNKLRSLEAHDVSCLVGEAAVQGGVRRTAMLSLGDRDDADMAKAKHGDFPEIRWNANNSSVWPAGGISDIEIEEHFREMDAGKRGERGIFSREAAAVTMPARRRETWPENVGIGVNPCGEVLLRPMGLCNLSIAVARHDDTIASLAEKVRAAAVFGTIQSTATNFPGLRPRWRENAEAERLLGVDVTGQRDCPLFNGANRSAVECYLRQIAVDANEVSASQLGISCSLAVTCVKPGGNSSTKLDCSPGLGARHSRFYVRNVRVSVYSPTYKVLRASGAPLSPENGQTAETATTWVCSFPVRAPEGAVVKSDLSAVNQLEIWLSSKLNYTEHNPSVTVTYRSDELSDVVDWVKQHRSLVGGLSFLPASNAAYQQMPYVEIDEAEYDRRAAAFPTINWSRIVDFEDEDMTSAAQELACSAGFCEI